MTTSDWLLWQNRMDVFQPSVCLLLPSDLHWPVSPLLLLWEHYTHIFHGYPGHPSADRKYPFYLRRPFCQDVPCAAPAIVSRQLRPGFGSDLFSKRRGNKSSFHIFVR